MDTNSASDRQVSVGRNTGDPLVLRVMEEFVSVEKEIIETGRLKISKTITEETATVNIPITNESYQVQRIPGPPDLLDSPPQALRKEGDLTIISVVREVSVVVTKYVLVEELRISRHITLTPLAQEITLRKEHVKIARSEPS